MDCYFTKPIRLNTLREIISDVTSGHLFDPICELSPVLKELFETLGREKVLGIWWVFFEELDQFFQDSTRDVLAKDNNALAEVAHKMKGAAAMLGQDLLEAPLAQLEIDARQGIVKDLTNRIQNLQDVAKQSEAAFEHYVTLII